MNVDRVVFHDHLRQIEGVTDEKVEDETNHGNCPKRIVSEKVNNRNFEIVFLLLIFLILLFDFSDLRESDRVLGLFVDFGNLREVFVSLFGFEVGYSIERCLSYIKHDPK